MRCLVASALSLAAIATSYLMATPAKAQEYPWCVQYGSRDGGVNCGFVTWDQCMAARFGNGGFCYRNPFYRGESLYAQQRPYRKHRYKHRDRY